MAEGQMLYTRFYNPGVAENEYLKSQQKYNDELKKIGEDEAKLAEEKRKAEEENQQKFIDESAAEVVIPSTTGMFDSDFAVADAWSNYLQDEATINQFAETKEGMAKYNQMVQQLNTFISESQQYYTTNFGSPNDPGASSTWGGAVSRGKLAGQGKNPWARDFLKDSNDMAYYEGVYQQLNDPNAHSFSVADGEVMIDGKPFNQYARQEAPFVANLVETEYITGYDVFMKNGAPLKLQTEEQARTVMENELKRGPIERQAIRMYIEQNNLQLTVDEVMERPQHLEKAREEYIQDGLKAWVKPDTSSTAKLSAGERTIAAQQKLQEETVEKRAARLTETAFKSENTVDIPTGDGKFTTVPAWHVYPVPEITDLIPINVDGEISQLRVQRIEFDNARGVVVVSGIELADGNSAAGRKIELDPDTFEGQKSLSQLDLALDVYGLTLEDLRTEAFDADLRVGPPTKVEKLNGGKKEEEEEGEEVASD